MFRTGKYKKVKTATLAGVAGAGWNVLPTPQLIQKMEAVEAKQEAKQEEEQVKLDRKKLFRAWQRF